VREAARAFPKAVRIRRRREFLRLQREGRRRHTAHLIVIRQRAQGATSRLGVTVSTRVGNAVARNRVKRLLREVFRSRRTEVNPLTDIVVIAKPGADVLSYAEVAIEFARALDLTPQS
jgi:ribonuclease P protein component